MRCVGKTTTEIGRKGEKTGRMAAILRISEHEDEDIRDYCTLRVGSQSTSYKDYICHKATLARASPFFEKTFFGNFKEAKMGPDEPILLDNIDQTVFECAMRYIFCQAATDISLKFAIAVYKFADEMLIDPITQELNKFFEGTTAPEIFALFDLYQFIGRKRGIDGCKQALEKATVEDLASDYWLEMSSESVEAFLKMDCLDVEEADLAKALVRWGRFQVLKGGGDPQDGAQLRSTILPGLKLLRFAVWNQAEFTQLCREELRLVLSDSEKNAFLKAITTGDWRLLQCNTNQRNSPPIVFQLNFIQNSNCFSLFAAHLTFQLNKNVEFLGLQVKNTVSAYETSFTFKLVDSLQSIVIGKGSSEAQKIVCYGEQYCPISPKCTLAADVQYKLIFTFKHRFMFSFYSYHKRPYYTPPALPDLPVGIRNLISHNGLTLKVESSATLVFVKSMLFLKLPT